MRRRPVSSHRSPEPTSRSSYVFLLWRGKDATSEHLAEAWSLTGYCASDLQSQLHAGVKDLLARFLYNDLSFIIMCDAAVLPARPRACREWIGRALRGARASDKDGKDRLGYGEDAR